MRYTPSGSPVTNFRLAVNRRTRAADNGEAQEETDWFPVVAWQKLGEICAQHLGKGSRVYIEGRLQVRQWEDQSGQKRYTTEIVASDLIMLDVRPAQDASVGTYRDPGQLDIDDPEIPF